MADSSGEAMVPLISDQLGGPYVAAPEPSGYNPAPTSIQQPPAYPQSQSSDIPYTVYQQPATVTQIQRKTIKTSKELDSSTWKENQYFISIILCITLTVFCNPFTLFCCIPAFFFASKAADENENDNYEKALSFNKKAKWLNAGGFIFIAVGIFVFTLVSFVVGYTIVANRHTSSMET